MRRIESANGDRLEQRGLDRLPKTTLRPPSEAWLARTLAELRRASLHDSPGKTGESR